MRKPRSLTWSSRRPRYSSWPSGRQTGAVAGAVQARRGRVRERVGHEALGGQLGAVEVAAGQPGAAQVQLAGHAHRHRPPGGVEHVGLGARERAPDRRRAGLAPGAQRRRRVRGVLAGPVEVPHRLHRRVLVQAVDQRLGQRLAGQRDRGHAFGQRALAQQRAQRRGHAVDQGHGRVEAGVGEREQVGHEHDAAAQGERDQQLEHGQVERERGGGQDAVALAVRERVAGPAGQRRHRSVLDQRALGPAGRARGVDHVREVGGRVRGRVGRRRRSSPRRPAATSTPASAGRRSALAASVSTIRAPLSASMKARRSGG